MAIALTQTIDLDFETFKTWAKEPGPGPDFDGDDPDLRPGFEELDRKVMGVEELQYAWTARRTWGVYRNDGGGLQFLSTVETIVPRWRKMQISSVGFLQVDTAIDPQLKTKIKEQMRTYDPSSGKDPLDWAKEIMEEGAEGFASFDMNLTFKVERDAHILEDKSAEDAQLAEWRKNESYYVKLLPPEQLLDEWSPPSPPAQAIEVKKDEIADPVVAQSHAEALAEAVVEPACEAVVFKDRVLDIFWYPEFKVTWELRTIRIGCIEVKLHLPILSTREATVQLWAYGAHPSDPHDLFEKIIRKCVERGLGAGIVLGLVFMNFLAALQAFQAVAVKCIVDSVGNTLSCVSAGLMLLTHHTDWKALW